jgi:hypothetical protein
MRAGEGEARYTPTRSQTFLRRLLIAAAAILGVWFVFVTMAPVVLAPVNRPHASPALATIEQRSFSAAGGASAVSVLTVPTQALFTNASGRLQVDVWYHGAPVATTVTIGLVGNTLTQITSGLQQGEQVMLSPVGQTLPSSPSPT